MSTTYKPGLTVDATADPRVAATGIITRVPPRSPARGMVDGDRTVDVRWDDQPGQLTGWTVDEVDALVADGTWVLGPARVPLTELRLQAQTWTVDHYLPRPGRDGCDAYDPFILDAPYQRGSVWTTAQRQALICSLLQGLPIGAVTIAHLGDANVQGYRIVDGKQRIETIRAWCDGQLAVPGWWFAARWLEGGEDARTDMVTYEDLSAYGQRSTYRWVLPAVETKVDTEWLEVEPGTGTHGSGHQFVLRHRTPAEMVAYEATLYGLVNGGGTPQTAADMTRAARIAEGETPPAQLDSDDCPRCGGDIHDHQLTADPSSDTDVYLCVIDVVDEAIEHIDAVDWSPEDLADIQPLTDALRAVRPAYAGHLRLNKD